MFKLRGGRGQGQCTTRTGGSGIVCCVMISRPPITIITCVISKINYNRFILERNNSVSVQNIGFLCSNTKLHKYSNNPTNSKIKTGAILAVNKYLRIKEIK